MQNFNKIASSLKRGTSYIRKPLAAYSIINLAIIYIVFARLNAIAVSISETAHFLFVGLFCFLSIFTILVGAFYKFPLGGKKRLLFDALGVVFGLILLVPMYEPLNIFLLCFIGPISLGLYVPCIITLIINSTNFENRGSVAGLFVFIVYLLVILLSPFTNGVFELGILIIALKAVTFFLRDEKSLVVYEGEYSPSEINIKAYFLFIWLIFIFVDHFSVIVFSFLVTRSELIWLNSITLLMGLFTMIFGGVMFDYFGRKRLLLFSYAYLGLVYAFISLSGGALIRISFLEGIAWGLLTPLFLIILWGDLCAPRERPIYVAITIVLFFANKLLELGGSASYIGVQEFFPLVSTLLFVATFIILFLPETLPERIQQKRELETYLQKAKEIKESYR